MGRSVGNDVAVSLGLFMQVRSLRGRSQYVFVQDGRSQRQVSKQGLSRLVGVGRVDRCCRGCCYCRR